LRTLLRKKFRREKIENLVDAWELQKINFGEKEFDQVVLFINFIHTIPCTPYNPITLLIR
jgi:hypothetical protein